MAATTAYTFNPFTGNLDIITTGLSPGDITGGTPNTLAGFDSTGTLFSPPGLEFSNSATNYYGININPSFATTLTDIQPLRVVSNVSGNTSGSYTGSNLTTNFGNLGTPTTLSNINQYAVYSALGADMTATNVQNFLDSTAILNGASISDLTSFQTSVGINQTTMNTLRAFQSSMSFGNSTASHLNGYIGLSISDQFGAFADIDNAHGVSINNNMAPGSVVDGYTGINVNNNIDTIMNGYRGVEVGANFGQNATTTVSNHIDFQAHPSYRINATLDQYTGLSMGPSFEEGSTTQNIQAIYYNMDIRGTVTGNVGGFSANNNLGNGTAPVSINNYQDMNLNPNFGANLTLGSYQALTIRPNVQSGATVTNDVRMFDIGLNSALPIAGSASGIQVDMSNFQTQATPSGLQVNVGGTQLNALFDTGIYPVQSSGGPFGLNNIGGTMHIAAGFPITGGNFGIGNNLGIGVLAEDDMPPDSSGLGLGFVMNGFLTQIGVANTKTMDFLTFMGAGAQDAAPGGGTGTIDKVALFRSIGILPTNGIVINNIYGFRVDAMLSATSPVNAWGVYVDDSNADNYFSKSVAINTTSKKVGASTTGLEINAKDLVLDGGDQYITAFAANGVVTNDATGLLASVAPGTTGNVLTSNGTSWVSSAPVTSTVPTIQTFTSGSGTYTTPANVVYIKVKMVGGGGGGGAAGAVATPGTDGTAGTDSEFGTALLVAGGGLGGSATVYGGQGGTASLGAAIGTAKTGTNGAIGALIAVTTGAIPGGAGGCSVYGGAGWGGSAGNGIAAGNAETNSGSGGGGASPTSAALSYCGQGGGSGGYVEAVIGTPAATYSYVVGAAGTGGTAGAGGNNGGNGAAGYIEVTEYY